MFVEADALTCWLEHRIQPVPPPPGELAFLDTGSEAVNGYYTHVATPGSPAAARPVSGIPAEVLHALDLVQQDRPQDWHAVATATLAVRPADWRPVRKALQPARPGAGTRRDRKRARRTADGVRLSSRLTVYVRDSTQATPPPPRGPAALLLRSP
ncbi:hypothetical protein [Streptomyces sasae]|uniref:hypothetical protein n=1 Tax=Streptomyces sasae TaxID=1266772 RepID=UPI0029314F61|nr:hypothetical protein [Streptomyces sasae]